MLPGLGFEVLGPIAAGAFSTILRCRNTSCVAIASGIEVAIKSFDGGKCASDETVGAARDREIAVLKALDEHAAVRPCHPRTRLRDSRIGGNALAASPERAHTPVAKDGRHSAPLTCSRTHVLT